MSWLGEKIQALLEWLAGVIGQWVAYVVEWLYDAIVSILQWIGRQLSTLFTFITETITPIWAWCSTLAVDLWEAFLAWNLQLLVLVKDWIIEWFGGFATWLEEQAVAMGIEINIEGIVSAFDLVATAYADAAWLLPLNGVAGIIASTLVTVALIRFARWVLSFLWITG